MAEYHYTISTAPTSYPVSVSEVKQHLRLDHDYEDDWIYQTIAAATDVIQHELDRQILTATWALNMDDFPEYDEPIFIQKAPLASVTSVQYYDTDNAQQTWSSSLYTVSTSFPGRICLVEGQSYPDTKERPDAVTVTFVAGASSVPATIQLAMQQLIGLWYDNREMVGQIPDGVMRLLDTERYDLDVANYNTKLRNRRYISSVDW